MRVGELILELQKFQPDLQVCIVDWRKHVHYANDEPQNNGIESKFEIEAVVEDVTTPFVALSFENDDYTKDGEPSMDSSLYESIRGAYRDEMT